jgi:hypothetical protein
MPISDNTLQNRNSVKNSKQAAMVGSAFSESAQDDWI